MRNLQLSPGSLFANRFEVQRAAGSGGMGTVYRAIDRYSGDTVALKLLHPGIGGTHEAARFAREAQLLSELRHPGIVAHVAHGQISDGQHFLVMEWLEGHDLGEHLSRGPLPAWDCLRLLNQIVDALAVAHRRGIIHRDLKPTNLFLISGDVGRVKILDFGIARRMATSQAMTRTGIVIGTPEYMAPEQARGSRDLTPAADLFSLGCILYESLTGQPPFVADHIAAVLVRILFEEPVPIEAYRAGVPAFLSALVGRLLLKDPAQRVADAAVLQAELMSLGELAEPALASTVELVSPKLGTFADQEQGLFSVVLAASAAEELGLGATQSETTMPLTTTQRQALLRALTGLGGVPDFLANGTLVLTVPPLGSAQDQAALAARAALLVKERWPEAVVAMATGRGALRGRTAVGDVVEMAERSLKGASQLSQANPPSGVILDPLSAKLLEGRFAQTPQPGGALLLCEERDMDTTRPLLGKPTPCVGREAELGSLESQLTACIEESQVRAVLITAAPGAGKSRLRHEFVRRISSRREAITVLMGRGDMMSAGAPYGILRTAIHKLCDISGSEPLDIQRSRLWTRVTQHLAVADRDRVVPFIGELGSIPFPDEGNPMLQAARQAPRIMRDCLRRALQDFLAAECAAAPVLVILDDLQWGDEPTLSIFDDTMRELEGAPLFVLAFARPEVRDVFPKLWRSHRRQEFPLRSLSKKAAERLIVHVLGKDVAPDVIAQAFEQSAGNALFLEELIRSIAEGKTERQSATILAMLQARLGRLDSNLRRLVLAASIFGQTFWSGGVTAVLGLVPGTLEIESGLSSLMETELIQPHPQSRLANELEYGFRHALMRDAAYNLLSDNDLQSAHLLAAEFLAAACEPNAATIAEHFERGGSKPRAAAYYAQAAEVALDTFCMERALCWIERALACGAEDELLGRLYAQESFAALFFGNPQRSFPAAMAALPLVQTGSLAWTRAMFAACICTVLGPPQWQAQFPILAQQLVAGDPELAAEDLYTEALSHTAATLGLVVPLKELTPALSRLEGLCDRAAARNPTLRRHLYLGRGRCLRFGSPTPWRIVQDIPELLTLLKQSGDRRNVHVASFLQVVWAELGDLDKAIEQIKDSELIEPNGEEVSAEMARQGQLCWLLAAHPSDQASWEQASAIARDVLAAMGPFPLTAVFAHDALARVLLSQGDLAAAEQAAYAACQILESVPALAPCAFATLIRIHIAANHRAEAVKVAESCLGLLARFGCFGFSEVELRLAISEAFAESGNKERARVELGETLSQIQLRAEDITDSFWKNSYLTRNPFCARAQQLAQDWELRQTPATVSAGS